MHHLRLFGVTLLAMFALFCAGAAVASAEDGEPRILTLPEEKIAGLTTKGETKESVTIESVSKQSIKCAKSTFDVGWDPIAGDEFDSDLGDGEFIFTGCKKAEVGCRSEVNGVKDPVETVLVDFDVHIAAEDAQLTDELLPLEIFKMSPEAGVTILCGLVKIKVVGSEGCLLLPGLEEVAAGTKLEVLCKQEGGEPLTGTCLAAKKLCEELAANPLSANFTGKFEGAALLMHLLTMFNDMVFIDD